MHNIFVKKNSKHILLKLETTLKYRGDYETKERLRLGYIIT
jgi:hypothetical protein